MKIAIDENVKTWDWKSQNIWEWENLIPIPTLIDRVERWYYKTKEVNIDLQVYNLRVESFTCDTLFQFLTHFTLVENADLKYPVILNNEWQVIDWRHRICKAIMRWYKSIKWIMILDSKVI